METIISVFLLACACLVLITLFHSSLGYSTRILMQTNATRIAESQMAQLRGWARLNFDGDWSDYANDSTFPAPEEPDYTIRIQHVVQEVYSPCSSTERQFPAANQRVLRGSFRRVTVTVSWRGGASNQVSLTSLIGAPSRSFDHMNVDFVTPLVDPMPPDSKVTMAAALYDSDGNEIPDVFFSWHVFPALGPGNPGAGVLDPSLAGNPRSGATAEFTNTYPSRSAGPWQSVPGYVSVRALARYRGIPREKELPAWQNQ